MGEQKIQSFTDLVAWKKGHSLVLSIYRITEAFPKIEMFALTNQIRRCAVSITSNIAEGFGRNSKKEKIRFYEISRGSFFEFQNQILIARDLGFMKKEEFNVLAQESIVISKLLSGLMKSVEKLR